jgi:hypothetical protein
MRLYYGGYGFYGGGPYYGYGYRPYRRWWW